MPTARKAKNEIKKTGKKAPTAPKVKAGWMAIIQTGGKQYKVGYDQRLRIEKIKGDYSEGDKVVFDKVLMLDDGKGTVTVGTPEIKGSKVEAVVQKMGRAKKVTVIRYKAKSRYFKKSGHRQPYFEVKIESIK